MATIMVARNTMDTLVKRTDILVAAGTTIMIKKRVNNFMFNKIAFIFVCAAALFGVFGTARAISDSGADTRQFKTIVIEVMDEKTQTDDNNKEFIQQILKLQGLEGEWRGKEIIYDGTALGAEIVGQNLYKKGDKVLAMRNLDNDGQETFYITDYVRTGKIYLLSFLFAAAVILIGRWRGFKALVGLAVSFIVLLQFIVPRILAGSNPLLISISGALVILAVTLYLVHGFNSKTTVAVFGTVLSLLLTGILAIIFTNLTRLTGFAEEEAAYLVTMGQSVLNMKGILLAGMIIGALGVLDDITISQASVAEQIYKANPDLSWREIYKRSMKVGVDHVSSIVNTLVLAYAGASLPLFLLFSLNTALPASQIINSEVVATEIVRTLVGSIGLVAAVPLTTIIAAMALKKKFIKIKNREGVEI